MGLIATKGPFMTSQDPNGVQIDRVHSGAICTEVGERLLAALARNPGQMPPRLLRLADLLDSGASSDMAARNALETNALEIGSR